MVELFWILNIILDILAGILAWNWVEPESFGGALLFLIVWGILGVVIYYISIVIMGLISGDFNRK